MADSLSDILADDLDGDDVQFLRYEAAILRDVNERLDLLTAALVREIRSEDPTAPARMATRQRRVEAVRQRLHNLARVAFREIRGNQIAGAAQWDGLAAVVVDTTRARVNRAIPRTLEQIADPRFPALQSVNLFNRQVDRATLRGFVRGVEVRGALPRDWWRAQGNAVAQQVAAELRIALQGTEPLSGLIERTARVMQRNRNQARALVQTTGNAITNGARDLLYRQHADVLEGIQWRSVLDNRTSETCIALSGLQWTLDGQPLGHGQPYPGPPPVHWGCRSTIFPIFQAWRPLIRRRRRLRQQLGRLPREGTELVDGQGARRQNYEGWLRRQSRARQIDALGRGKWELWRSGKIGLTDLIDQRARPLTLAQLRQLVEREGR